MYGPQEAGKAPACECPEVYCANDCSWVGDEEDLIDDAAGNEPHCPKCGSNSAILDIPEEIQRAVTRYYAALSAPRPCAERAAAFVRLSEQLLARYVETFPTYAWTDDAAAIDLMAAEITTLRAELAAEKQRAGLFDEIVARLRGAFIVAHLGDWTEWQDAINRFLKAVQVQEHLARLASQRHDRIIELERDLCGARSAEAESKRLRARVGTLETALTVLGREVRNCSGRSDAVDRALENADAALKEGK